ncbi:helix-turn-helix domain-containing protein [Caulobacter mirabilis]|uniref:Transcriptional regulator n=1 Tax=Caulobacter mirabilis TaxID=69666 RepID=A0A2D2AW94_9CAUL|nr:helix-turn-helix transcriptional regulator [Caulobacter mirabilis]ATQ42288.1 transcriptional regulator [Caulobacter mirabilis]
MGRVHDAKPEPHPVDRHVGRAIRLRRRGAGMSQQVLAAWVGVTFQQIQKYERGANRVSASVLHAIAGALGCAPGAFFEGLETGGGGKGGPRPGQITGLVADMLAAPGGAELAAAWLAVPPGPVRSRLTALVLAVGDGAREVSAG